MKIIISENQNARKFREQYTTNLKLLISLKVIIIKEAVLDRHLLEALELLDLRPLHDEQPHDAAEVVGLERARLRHRLEHVLRVPRLRAKHVCTCASCVRASGTHACICCACRGCEQNMFARARPVCVRAVRA